MDIHMKRFFVFQHHTQPELIVEERYFSMLFIERGFLLIALDGEEQRVSQGQIWINTPAMTVVPSYVSADCSILGVKYTLDYTKEITTLSDFHNTFAYFEYQYLPIWDLSVREQEIIVPLFLKLKERKASFGHHPFAHPLFNLTFTELVLELIAIGSKRDKEWFKNYNRAEYLAVQFMILARESYKEQTKLDFYADQLAVSVKYLSETLKRITGKTAKDILLELRLAQAKLFLTTSELTIAEIAYELSYASPASFSKSFKQEIGLSPKAYRETPI